MNIADFLLPKLCLGCSVPGAYICKRCRATKLLPSYAHQCHVCRNESRIGLVHTNCRKMTYLDGVAINFVYNDFAEQIMKELKYKYTYSLAEEIAEIMMIGLSRLPVKTIDIVTWVPLANYKKRKRGFNQAGLIAKKAAELSGMNPEKILIRPRNTVTQVGKQQQDRLGNLDDAFALRKGITIPKSVLLVDDIMTTGSTLEHCAKKLKLEGVESVYGLVFARGAVVPEEF